MSKTALITGASGGIGREIAIKLSTKGYDIAINYCGDEASANEVKKICEENGVMAEIFKFDVSKSDEVNSEIDRIIKEFGTIDVLVNNSGITRDKLLMRMSEDDFDKVIDVNLKGTFNCTKKVAIKMMKQKSGVIINMASVSGLIGNIGQANYAASKAGVVGFTKTVAKEFSGFNVRCNAVAPGFIATKMTDVLGEDVKESILNQIPLKRFGKTEDVANLVSFLVSDEASYITGQVINVDGGMVI